MKDCQPHFSSICRQRYHIRCLALVFVAAAATCPVGAQQFILRGAAAPESEGKSVSIPSPGQKAAARHERKVGTAQVVLRHKPAAPQKRLPKEFIVLSCDQLFEPSKDALTAAGEAKLKALTERLRAQSGHAIVIVGHSDSLGFERFNQDLSKRCAARVKSWIVSHGLVNSNTVQIRGAGSSEPIASEALPSGRDNEAGRARNRRIEIIIDPNVDIAQELADAAAAKVEKEAAEKAAAPPPVEDSGLVGMVPATVEDLTEHLPAEASAANQQQSATHQSNTAEWGTGGTNFGENLNPSFVGGGGAQLNEESTASKKAAFDPAEQEKRIKDTIDAQNEFGLWRERW